MLPKSVLIILGSALLVLIAILAFSLNSHAEILLPALKADDTPHISVGDQFVKS